MNQLKKTNTLIYAGLFSCIAYILMYISFPIPLMPPFLKVDLSGVISIIATIMLGPINAILITAVKDILQGIFNTTTAGIGELADFLMISSFCIVFYLLYNSKNIKIHKSLQFSISIIIMSVIGVITNKYMILPFYSKVMPIEQIIEMCKAVNPYIGNIDTYLLVGVLPFNIIKGIILSVFSVLLYKRLKSIIK